MRKNVLTIMVLLISGTILAQNGGTFMKKYENQLPQSGYRIRFAQSRHQIMQENPSISIELPLKISVWEDKNGIVWATFPLMKPMAANYGLENEPVIEKMQTLLENIVIKSASVCSHFVFVLQYIVFLMLFVDL